MRAGTLLAITYRTAVFIGDVLRGHQLLELTCFDIDHVTFHARAQTNSSGMLGWTEVVIQSGQMVSRLSVEPNPL